MVYTILKQVLDAAGNAGFIDETYFTGSETDAKSRANTLTLLDGIVRKLQFDLENGVTSEIIL